MNEIKLDLEEIYKSISGETAKLSDIEKYIEKALKISGEGNIIILTGAAPIWMYLKSAHALHGKARELYYSSPGQGIEKFEIFTHDPF